MKRFSICLLLLLAACGTSSGAPKQLTTASSASAPSQQPAHIYGNWQVMRIPGDKDKPLCYAGAAPVKSNGPAVDRRGTPYLMITKRANGKLEVSASSGYSYMRSSAVDLVIDGQAHHLFFKDSVAWARGKDKDLAIINSVRSGSVIELRGVSTEGKTSLDTYSPHGFWQAIAGIRELCP